MDGWLKLHRKILDKPIWQLSTPEQKTILITLLLMANHEENEWEFKGERFICKPGQMITSLPSIAKISGKNISIQNVRTALTRFKKYEFLTDEPTGQSRLITICNWYSYQDNQQTPNKRANRRLTDSQQIPNRRLTSNKNDKECKNNSSISKEILCQTSSDSTESTNYKKFVEWFNSETQGVFGTIRCPLSNSRKKMLSARIKEHGKDAVGEVVKKSIESDFMKGQNNRGWTATFDWIIRPTNFEKILTGNYDNKKNNRNNTGNSSPTSDELSAAIEIGLGLAAAAKNK